MTSIQ
jgi:hypothetical protein